MSVQETKLTAIANAIREKEGSTEPIPANDFPERIRAINTIPKDVHEINLSVSDPEGGTVQGGGLASEGMTITVGAQTVGRYRFDGWQEGGEVISADKNFTFQVSGDRNLTAAVQPLPPITGIAWTRVDLPVSDAWSAITYGNGIFVAVAGYISQQNGSRTSKNVAYSSDGITWAKAALPYENYWTSVTCGNGVFVATGRDGSTARSTDGITWTFKSSGQGQLSSITYGSDMFVAVAGQSLLTSSSGQKTAIYSTDGINWLQATLPVEMLYQSIIYGDGLFVAVGSKNSSSYGAGEHTDAAIYSTDGINWAQTTLPVKAAWTSVTYGDGVFVAVGVYLDGALQHNRAAVAYSTDGVNWVQANVPVIAAWGSAAYGDGVFVAVEGCSAVAAVTRVCTAIYSTDGINWTKITLPISSNRAAIAYGNDMFITVSREENGGQSTLRGTILTGEA